MAKVSKVTGGPTFQALTTVNAGMLPELRTSGLSAQGALVREQSLGFCSAARNSQGRDRGRAWMSQLPRFSPKSRKKRSHRVLDTFSSG